MPIYKQEVDYDGDKIGQAERISLLDIIKEYNLDNDSGGMLENIKYDINKLCFLFEEFLESTEEGKKFIKDKIKYYRMNNIYYEEEQCQ